MRMVMGMALGTIKVMAIMIVIVTAMVHKRKNPGQPLLPLLLCERESVAEATRLDGAVGNIARATTA